MQYILQDIPIGKNIREIRMRKEMTQMDVITRIQLKGSIMSRSTLANIESGRRNIKASDLKLLKEIFNVEYNELFAE
ncbi:MAG TPA: helix-turn-helix domain-containing protein [Candidatus Eisenbergiella merdavium]|uniref:Helix-turn-helix domain-containing protein n=1 Tax=Candidatus Eisenbergiella merdavium TaxID=2838551 RepID=A0A9D2NEC8_9FIRM|nr:helix-turn-helix domain-containing protein [Candidatus Eisenbergiella merdavium]